MKRYKCRSKPNKEMRNSHYNKKKEKRWNISTHHLWTNHSTSQPTISQNKWKEKDRQHKNKDSRIKCNYSSWRQRNISKWKMLLKLLKNLPSNHKSKNRKSMNRWLISTKNPKKKRTVLRNNLFLYISTEQRSMKKRLLRKN